MPPSPPIAARAVERQPHARGIDRALDHVGEPADARRMPPPHGKVEDLFRQLRHALHDRSAAGDDDARRGGVLEPGLAELSRDEGEDLLDARLDDLGKDLAGQLARLAPAHRGHGDDLVFAHERGQRAPEALLELLGFSRRRAETDRDVVRDVVAAQRQDARVPDGAVAVERGVGRAPAEIDQQDAQLLLLVGDDGLGGCERLEHDVLHLESRAVA